MPLLRGVHKVGPVSPQSEQHVQGVLQTPTATPGYLSLGAIGVLFSTFNMTTDNIAVLIDADNVSHKVIAGLMAEIASHGKASVRRIYGDWTNCLMNGWKKCLLDHSFTPMQQFAYTTGKNATDGAMIIDAMDLLYTGRFSTFCIVSSDSDFTRLAGRIREQGVTVIGFGQRNTVHAFVAACDQFVYFDALPGVSDEDTEKAPDKVIEDRTVQDGQRMVEDLREKIVKDSPVAPQSAQPIARVPTAPAAMVKRASGGSRNIVRCEPSGWPLDPAATEVLRKAISSSIGDDSEYAYLAEVGIRLARISPDLNARNYGYQNLRGLVEASKIAVLKTKILEGKPPVALVRLKKSQEVIRPS